MKNDENKPNDLRSELEKLRGALTWRPWVGEKYPAEGGLLVVGESNFVDATNDIVDYPEGVTPETAVDTVNKDWEFTNKVIKRFCIDRIPVTRYTLTKKGHKFPPTLEAIFKVLNDLPDSDEKSRAVWNSIAYMDLIQCALVGNWGNKDRARPTEEMWGPGWTAVLAAIAVLKPGKLLFVGSDVATTCNKKFLPENAQAHVVNDRKIGSCWLRRGWLQPPNSNRIDFVGIPNPGGAHGFSPADWKDALESPKPGRR